MRRRINLSFIIFVIIRRQSIRLFSRIIGLRRSGVSLYSCIRGLGHRRGISLGRFRIIKLRRLLC